MARCACGHDHGTGEHVDASHPPPSVQSVIDVARLSAFGVCSRTPLQPVFTKPYELRSVLHPYFEADDDPEFIVHIPLACTVKLRHIMIVGNSELEMLVRQVSVFVNDDSVDFDNVEHKTAAQIIDLSAPGSQSHEVLYPVKPAKFQNVSHLALYFRADGGAAVADGKLRVGYIGLFGEATGHRREVVHAVYEVTPVSKGTQVEDARKTAWNSAV
eukprot:ANDGO_00088.mRNA.1 PITH domain-containing protein 1